MAEMWWVELAGLAATEKKKVGCIWFVAVSNDTVYCVIKLTGVA